MIWPAATAVTENRRGRGGRGGRGRGWCRAGHFILEIDFLLGSSDDLRRLNVLDCFFQATTYAFLGSLRSTAGLMSYESILSSAILLLVLLIGGLNLTVEGKAQSICFILSLLSTPIYIGFLIVRNNFNGNAIRPRIKRSDECSQARRTSC